MRELRLSFIFACIYFFSSASNAQVFPIQSAVTLQPPYSPRLSDYTNAGSQRITLRISANDATLNSFPIKLRLLIEGVGITIRSKPNLIVDPIVINGGFPVTLFGDDLRDYFDINNLDFLGLSRAEYLRAGKLPDGVYRFSFEVLDYNRGTVVSNRGFATAWIILNDPPVLNLPSTNTKLRILDPTNIPFTWTPRHTSSPNSAFTTEYTFRVIELWPINRNPNDAFLTQAPLYEVETTQSQIVYGPGEPSLIPGRKYAWQVQARDTEGRDLFRNNGRSEVFVFQFGDAIEMPQNLRKELATPTTISLRWEPSPTGEIAERFRVRYRAEDGDIWYEEVTTQYWHTLSSLQNNKGYDVQVRAETAQQVSEYTQVQRIRTTVPVVDENFQCGNPFNMEAPKMTVPLQFLKPGDVIKCADFDIYVVQANLPSVTSPGSFSGVGYARVYMFNHANIEVTFSGTFNREYQMVTGSFHSTYQKGSKIDRLTEEMKDIGKEKPLLPADSTAKNPESNLIIITKAVDSVYTNAEGEIIVMLEGGGSEKYQQKKDDTSGQKQEMIVEDVDGNKWTIDKDGNVIKAESAIAGVYTSRDSLNFVVKFKKSESELYGFDQHENTLGNYEQTSINGETFSIAWKAVELGKQDFVEASVEGKSNFPSKVGFKKESQASSFQPSDQPGARKVIINGAMSNDKESLIAYAELKSGSETSDVILGKLNVVTYEYISRKVVIVPVNSPTTLTEYGLQSELNKIYGQAVAGWQVTVAPVFNIDASYLDKIDEEESDDLHSYNKKMRAFQKAFKKSLNDFDKNAYYVFLIKGTDYNKNGFMPFNRGYGYVFVDKTSNIIKTIAHELGHGAFNLRHTFVENPSVTKNSTDNLMDYTPDGTKLKKYQWDYVHDPESVISWLMDDEDAALTASTTEEIVGYVISDPVAYIRLIEPPNNVKEPKEVLTQGKEAKLINTTSAGAMGIVKYLDSDNLYVTSMGNIKAIVKLTTPAKFLVLNEAEALTLPYSSVVAAYKPTKDTYVLADKSCGEFWQIKENNSTNQGWWINKKDLKRVDNDVAPNFDWMTTVTLSEGTVQAVELNKVISNRTSINDRTNRDIYGNQALKTSGTGYFYSGNDGQLSPVFSGTEFEKQVKKTILDEIAKEGSYGSINTYDGEIFTWGKGFAVTGTLMDVFSRLFENDPNMEQIFSNVGLKIVDDALWLLDDSGNWLKDNPSNSDYPASKYVKTSKQLLSFFIELAEKKDYQQKVVQAQYDVFEQGAGKYPAYILNANKSAYADSWNDESVTVLAHLSHWCGHRWNAGTDRYKDTNGNLDKILYKYIYNTVVTYQATRSSGPHETNIYFWNSNYAIIDRLAHFGNPTGAGKTKLEATWASHSIEIELKNDKSTKKRLVKKTTTDYLTNSECVLVYKDSKHLVVTKNGEALTYGTFEEK